MVELKDAEGIKINIYGIPHGNFILVDKVCSLPIHLGLEFTFDSESHLIYRRTSPFSLTSEALRQ